MNVKYKICLLNVVEPENKVAWYENYYKSSCTSKYYHVNILSILCKHTLVKKLKPLNCIDNKPKKCKYCLYCKNLLFTMGGKKNTSI